MLNIMRADLYRIVRSKGLYITLALLTALITLQVIVNNVGYVGTRTVNEDSSVMIEIGEDGTMATQSTFGDTPLFTGKVAPFSMMSSADNILYFMLAFIIFIAGIDFSSGAVKNSLSNGIPRIKFYIAKLILISIFCFVLLFLNSILIPITVGTIKNGFGGDFNLEFIGSVMRPFLAQLFMCLSAICVGVFFTFVTKRTAAVNGAFIAFLMIPMMVFLMLSFINNDLKFLLDYDLVTNIRALVNIDTASSTEIIRAFALGGFYIVASTVGGILIFKKSEIK